MGLPKKNDSPHYIVAKAIYNLNDGLEGFIDLSPYVCEVLFTTDLGNLPSTKLSLAPESGVEFSEGALLLPNGQVVERNDRVLVVETDEENYNLFTGGGTYDREIKDGIFIMWGCIADVMSSLSSKSKSMSIILESELAYLDTTLTQEMVGARGAGMTNAALLSKDTPSNGPVKTESFGAGSVEERLIEKFITQPGDKDPLFVHEAFVEFSETGVDGIMTLPLTNTYPVVLSHPSNGRVTISPWRLVRLVLSHCIAQCTPKDENQADTFGVDLEEVRERANRIITLMYLIDVQDGEDPNAFISLSRNEYSDFLISSVIKPIVSAPASAPSIWQLINGILNQMHFYFTPKVLYHSSGAQEKNLGSFKMMNPYREYTTAFNRSHLVSVNNTIPGYKSIIKSVGFKTGVDIPKLVGEEDVELTRAMYMVYRPSEDDFVVGTDTRAVKEIRNLGQEPQYAYHKQIGFPNWLPSALISLYKLYVGDLGTEDVESENVGATKSKSGPEVAGGDPYKSSLRSFAETLNAFTRSALMIYGRINVTSKIELVRLWSDCIDPLRVVLVDLGPGEQQTTGLVTRITLQWVQGKRYTVSVNLSNVTDLRDPYFRPLNGDLGQTTTDNLTKYLDETEEKPVSE